MGDDYAVRLFHYHVTAARNCYKDEKKTFSVRGNIKKSKNVGLCARVNHRHRWKQTAPNSTARLIATLKTHGETRPKLLVRDKQQLDWQLSVAGVMTMVTSDGQLGGDGRGRVSTKQKLHSEIKKDVEFSVYRVQSWESGVIR